MNYGAHLSLSNPKRVHSEDFSVLFSARNCTENDYKPWSPYHPGDKKMTCVLGRKDVFKRRIPLANCFNGLNFDSPILKENCECDKSDYMW